MAGRGRILLLGGGNYSGEAGNILLQGMSNKEIEKSISEFMAGDSEFNMNIKKHLLARLKYATGKLINSLQWKAKVKINGRTNNFNISIGVYLTDDNLIDALLSGKELDLYGKNKLPSLNALVAYVSAKKAYYSEMLNADNEGMLYKYRQGMVSKNIKAQVPDTIQNIAIGIRKAMQKRMIKGLNPTRGSEYAFLGVEKIKMGDKYKFVNRYKRFSTPLYTIESENGEINKAINACLSKYWALFFDKDVTQSIVNDLAGDSLIETLANVFPEYIEDKSIASQIRLMADKLLTIRQDIEAKKKFTGQYAWAEKNVVDKMVNVAKVRIKREIEYHPANRTEINNEMIKVINEIEKYSVSLRKRAATRKR